MGFVSVALIFPASVHEAESCWYDTSRWPSWVDGLERIVGVQGDWPAAGATVRWESGPAGRGRVLETVLAYEPLGGQTVEVEDDSIHGHQILAFTPVDGSVEVALSLDYELTRRTLLTRLIDPLFIRRAMSASLRLTLERFGAELGAARPPSVG